LGITQNYPDNPNGSLNAIAGICDPYGNILGLMPHPERNIEYFHNPNWRKDRDRLPDGLKLIKTVVNYAKEM
jgi:phosphoribosylformylglycinamidine synthase